jgi:histidinol-phosphatase
MKIMNLEEYLAFAQKTVIAAGKITLEYFQKSVVIEVKYDYTPVTEVDRTVEIFIRRCIQEAYPTHAILGEEFKEKNSESQFRWIIDPIDSTQSFIHGIPLYTVLLALLSDGEHQLGVIHSPATQETVAAVTGIGCKYNNKPCHVSETSELSKAWIQVTDYADRIGMCRVMKYLYGIL